MSLLLSQEKAYWDITETLLKLLAFSLYMPFLLFAFSFWFIRGGMVTLGIPLVRLLPKKSENFMWQIRRLYNLSFSTPTSFAFFMSLGVTWVILHPIFIGYLKLYLFLYPAHLGHIFK
jgi:hypothetical protein